jgi:hypothetical protein
MRTIFILASCLALSGCFFFWIPIHSGETFSGNTCVNSAAYVGQRIKNTDGRFGTLKTIYGSSDKCRQDVAMPILVEVEYDEGKK